MTEQHTYPPGQWGSLARQWFRALKSENKSKNTITTYLYAVRILGEWAHSQSEPIPPTEIQPQHIRDFIADLIDRTSAANAHTNYRALRTFFRWLVEDEEEIDRSPMDPHQGAIRTGEAGPDRQRRRHPRDDRGVRWS